MLLQRSLLATLLLAGVALAEPDAEQKNDKKSRDPKNVSLSDSPETALKKFSVAEGLKVDVWAAEPLLSDPVAFSFDQRGRCFVAETGRRRTSAPDIRKNMDWLLPDLALRSVEDRIAFLKKVNPEIGRKPDKDHVDLNGDGQFDWRDLVIETERIRLVQDTDGDGAADSSSIYAEQFNKLESGVAAGVLAWGNDVWFTAIPDLWRLQGPGSAADAREAILTGFGVHVAYSGHDMHGPKMGPDGRVYWSIADCGANVRTKEGATISAPDMGAVFRANPDGTGMELFAYGLRNPQSLAFNDVGDLFTGDNNADGGDKARWEHVVEGADYGWRMGWQFLPKLGAWNSERLWELDAGQTALSILPPVGHIGHGPAGIAYYPGTGLPAAYRDHFFYADFPGGVRSFALKRRGASYTVENPNELLLDNTPQEMKGKLLWGLYPSDVQFGVDGGAYVLDWVQGWEKTGKGRIFRVHDPATDASRLVHESKARLAEDFSKMPEEELHHRLDDADVRVRMNAQFALAARGEPSIAGLAKIAASAVTKNETDRTSAHPVSRLHAIWALGQIGRGGQPKAYAAVAPLLGDREPEVRAQAAKILGESKQPAQAAPLIPLLQDGEPRVRFFAAQALGKLHPQEAVNPLLAFLRDGVRDDAFLRHAAVLALAQCGDVAALTSASRDASDGVRAGVLLALRRLHRPEVATFLEDWNPQLVLEAARAIHDEPIAAALPQLALWAGQAGLSTPLARRVVNAAYLTGTAANANALAKWAADPKAPEATRQDAIDALAQWSADLGRDRVVGLSRPLPSTRVASAAAPAARGIVAGLLKDAHDSIRAAAANMAGALLLKEAEPELFAAATDANVSPEVRLAALKALATLDSPHLKDALDTALSSTDKALSLEARRLSLKLSPGDALSQASLALETGTVEEKQSALQSLGTLPDHEADKILAKWLDRLAQGKVPPAAQLELLESAALRKDARVKEKLAAFEAKRDPNDPLAHYKECLEGGDAAIGRQVFAEKAEAACMRCHKVKGEGGDVGPDLAGLASKHDRTYLLESIVHPNGAIAQGFENVLLTLKDGSFAVGIASSEDATEIVLTPLAPGPRQHVKKADIKQRDIVPSPMPEGLAEVLGKRDLRNVVEYLSSLK
jgi:quinoprotein glucose dehydrogenase